MAPNVATYAQGVRCYVLDPDRGFGRGVVSEFLTRYLRCSHNKVIRVAPGTVPRGKTPTIKLDRLIEMRWFSLAGDDHLGVLGDSLAIEALG